MLIDGKTIAEEIQRDLKTKIQSVTGRKPGLAVILVGDNPASQLYVNRKTQACEEVGIRSIKRLFPSSIAETDLLKEVENLNHDPEVDGILVQLPLPPQVDPTHIMRRIDPTKDVDGFHPVNVGKLLIGETDGFVSCTPLGIKVLLNKTLDLTGKHVVILGRSNVVGKPLAALLIQRDVNATVTVLHSKSENIPEICRTADVLVAAMGQAKFITKEMVKKGAIIIDVGTNRVVNPAKKSGFELVGDVDFANVKDVCSYITPGPGGVGPMTIAMLLTNTWASYTRRQKH
jgi:methylenetetrahydrofolate dehydrogenase (NADP+)/methenyltetrahydrofolate cyclohydrolase